MSHPLRTAFLFVVPLVVLGCDSRRPTAGGPKAGEGVASDVNVLAPLEANPDFGHCRTALQQLDTQERAATRPALSDAEKTAVGTLLHLTAAETAAVGQTTFTPADAAYLEECLLVRAGVRSLRADARPPLERAKIGFDWVCRMVYTDDRVPWPANPWATLEGGVGIPLSRAYCVLAAWQQLGLDGCLVGPPDLKTARSITLNPIDPRAKATYAPARACGVKVGDDLFLFDPATGRPITAAGGDVLTLAKLQKAPAAAKDYPADEVATWQPFLAPALPGVSKRMEWLEQRNPGGAGVRLFVDLAALRARLGGPAVEAWCLETDPFSATRVLARYASDEPVTAGGPPLRESHRIALLPLEHLPRKTNLAISYMLPAFSKPFEQLRFSPGTPEDLIVRGQFSDAMNSLDELKKKTDDARTRFDQDSGVLKDFEEWADRFQRLQVRVARPAADDPGGAGAQRELDQFRADRRNQDIERAFVLGTASRPLGAEVTYLLALCVHERAERARQEGAATAVGQWKNAAEWWQRYLDASTQANTPLPARDTHARTLLARAQQYAGK
jgi:hypothetical protein